MVRSWFTIYHTLDSRLPTIDNTDQTELLNCFKAFCLFERLINTPAKHLVVA
jgi:hypothetical protein